MKLSTIDLRLYRWAHWLLTSGGQISASPIAHWGMPARGKGEHDTPITHDAERETDGLVSLLPEAERRIVRAYYLEHSTPDAMHRAGATSQRDAEDKLIRAQRMIATMIRQRQAGEQIDPLADRRPQRTVLRVERPGRRKPAPYASVAVDA